MKLKLLLLGFGLAMVLPSYGQSYSYTKPEPKGDGWATQSLLEIGADTILIDTLFTQLFQQKHKIHSALVIKNGDLVVEEYFNENRWNGQHDMRSATKSIISLLVGIAIDKGDIESIDDPIYKYLKNKAPKKNRDSRKEAIRVRDLLTMSTGLDCNDWDKKSEGQEDKVYRKKDWIQYTLDLPMHHAPGTVSKYCSMGTVLAAEVVSKASGLPFHEFAKKNLFDPLGITNVSWGHTSKRKIIPPSAKRLYMTPRDMAKIGSLVMHKGTWKGKQVISQKWITEAIKPQTKIGKLDYGFLWWNIPFSLHGTPVIGTLATGNGGQYIMIFEAYDLVVVFTGGAYNSEESKVPFAITNNIFLPVFGG